MNKSSSTLKKNNNKMVFSFWDKLTIFCCGELAVCQLVKDCRRIVVACWTEMVR